ncbi:hypothetical protein ACWCQK_39420 [Streptomyces sp. NPDC002306]
MTGDLHFSWKLYSTGWATCRIADNSSECEDFVSYCTDALADLLYAVAGLYGPSHVQRVSFDLEPAEARWVLRRRGPDVDIAIYRFPDMAVDFGLPDREGSLSWSSTQPRSSLSHAVTEAAQAVLRAHGENGYHKKWRRYPFPTAALADLRRLHLRDDDCRHEHDMTLP